MKILEQAGAAAPEIPRFDDGMVNVQELLRAIAEAAISEIMDARADGACADGNQRNGYREHDLVTGVGAIRLRIPKLRRGSRFPDDILTRCTRVDRAVAAAPAEMVTNGVSTRKVERVAAAMGVDRMSASQVSRICASLDETVAGADGYRRLLGLDAIDTETYAGWLGFLRSLRERGVFGVACATSDAHEGLRRAIEEVFPSRESLIRMLGAVFSEMDEDWSSRRWFTEESMALASSPAKAACPAPSYEGTAEEHARRIIELVAADNPVGRRTA